MESTTYFNTITQYDHSLDEIWDNDKSCKKGLACPFFALFTAQEFMNNNKKDEEAYLKVLNKAIYTNKILNIHDELSFTNLLSYSDLNLDNICYTISTLIKSGEFDIKKVFTEKNNCAFIFLKNGKFFTIVKDTHYHIRDCHEITQYTFDSIDLLLEHLNIIYQFDQRIVIDDIPYDEYSSIEFLKINMPFITPFDDDKEEEKTPAENIIDFTINDTPLESTLPGNRENGAFLNFDISKLE